jgi:hypothetical protein
VIVPDIEVMRERVEELEQLIGRIASASTKKARHDVADEIAEEYGK